METEDLWSESEERRQLIDVHTDDHRLLIDAKIKYQRATIERVGRFDWKHIAEDVLVGLGIALTRTQLQRGAFKQIVSMRGRLFGVLQIPQ